MLMTGVFMGQGTNFFGRFASKGSDIVIIVTFDTALEEFGVRDHATLECHDIFNFRGTHRIDTCTLGSDSLNLKLKNAEGEELVIMGKLTTPRSQEETISGSAKIIFIQ